jgi:predicted RNA polymerase sigma factor
VDRVRRAEVHEQKTSELGREIEIYGQIENLDLEAEIDDPFDDDLLRLIFTTCLPCSRPMRGSRSRSAYSPA